MAVVILSVEARKFGIHFLTTKKYPAIIHGPSVRMNSIFSLSWSLSM
ncbi:hypothetical protein ACJIZ3_007311 [Penstemon smallii]|uniref:Uncharacterized protein n=1 Tax=Penstemon smallii TaxID=265156 RepID=A0ABD3SA60_9LAMI